MTVNIDINHEHDKGSSGKSFPILDGEIKILHNTESGRNIVEVEINGIIEFRYDFHNPDEAVYGYFSPFKKYVKTKH